MMPGLLSSNTIDPTAFIVSNCAFQDCYGIIVRPMRIIPCRPVLVNLACLLSCCHLLMHHNACLPICLIKYCFHSVVVITRPSQHDCTPIIARTRSWVRAPVKAIVLLSFAISPCFFWIDNDRRGQFRVQSILAFLVCEPLVLHASSASKLARRLLGDARSGRVTSPRAPQGTILDFTRPNWLGLKVHVKRDDKTGIILLQETLTSTNCQ
jgi:hypothetical protein